MYHVYLLLNKSLVQYITGVCVYILFLETSGPYLDWVHTLFHSTVHCFKVIGQTVQLSWKAVWPSAQRVRLNIRRYRVQVPLWPLAGFVLGPSKFKSSSTLVNSQLAASCQLGFFILLCSTVKPLLSGPPIKQTLSRVPKRTSAWYFPLWRTPIQRRPLLSGRGH